VKPDTFVQNSWRQILTACFIPSSRQLQEFVAGMIDSIRDPEVDGVLIKLERMKDGDSFLSPKSKKPVAEKVVGDFFSDEELPRNPFRNGIFKCGPH
jgi:hypothetical protein